MVIAYRGETAPERPDVEIARLAARQHGVVSRVQAVDAGLSRSAIDRRLGAGRWSIVLPGIYRLEGAPSTGRQRAMAACLWGGPEAVVSHRTAGVLWGLDGVTGERIEISVPRSVSARSRRCRVHHVSVLTRVDRATIAGIPVTSVARTVVDLASTLDADDLERALEDALRRGVTVQGMRRRLRGRGHAGTRVLRRLLEERDQGVAPLESELERRVWNCIVRSDLPRPVRQLSVRGAESRGYRIDFAYPEDLVAIECDGWRAHGGRRAFARDRRRAGELASLGWRIVYATWDDLDDAGAFLRRLRRVLRLGPVAVDPGYRGPGAQERDAGPG
jgi:predicted transcriptional regulator of viral defense system